MAPARTPVPPLRAALRQNVGRCPLDQDEVHEERALHVLCRQHGLLRLTHSLAGDGDCDWLASLQHQGQALQSAVRQRLRGVVDVPHDAHQIRRQNAFPVTDPREEQAPEDSGAAPSDDRPAEEGRSY